MGTPGRRGPRPPAPTVDSRGALSAEQRPPAEPSYAPGRAPLSGALWRDARPAPGLCLSSPPASTSRHWRNTFLLSLLWTLLRVPGENGSSPPWPLCGEDQQTLFGGGKKFIKKFYYFISCKVYWLRISKVGEGLRTIMLSGAGRVRKQSGAIPQQPSASCCCPYQKKMKAEEERGDPGVPGRSGEIRKPGVC